MYNVNNTETKKGIITK